MCVCICVHASKQCISACACHPQISDVMGTESHLWCSTYNPAGTCTDYFRYISSSVLQLVRPVTHARTHARTHTQCGPNLLLLLLFCFFFERCKCPGAVCVRACARVYVLRMYKQISNVYSRVYILHMYVHMCNMPVCVFTCVTRLYYCPLPTSRT